MLRIGRDMEVGTPIVGFQAGSEQVTASLDAEAIFKRIDSTRYETISRLGLIDTHMTTGGPVSVGIVAGNANVGPANTFWRTGVHLPK